MSNQFEVECEPANELVETLIDSGMCSEFVRS